MHLPRWMLDRIGHKKQADRVDGTALNTLVQEAIKRYTSEAPIVANTGKPVSIKRARKNVKEQMVIDAEKIEEEKKLQEFKDSFIRSAAQTDRANFLEAQKNEELAATIDALILFATAEDLSHECVAILRSSKRLAKLRMVERCCVADAAAAVEAERMEEVVTQIGSGSLV